MDACGEAAKVDKIPVKNQRWLFEVASACQGLDGLLQNGKTLEKSALPGRVRPINQRDRGKFRLLPSSEGLDVFDIEALDHREHRQPHGADRRTRPQASEARIASTEIATDLAGAVKRLGTSGNSTFSGVRMSNP